MNQPKPRCLPLARPRSVRPAAFAAAVLGAVCGVQALYITSPTPQMNNRFASGFATTPVPNTDPSYLGLGYDLSGVGWRAGSGLTNIFPADRVQSLTMISPLNFAVAQHYSPGFFVSGTPLDFVNSQGQFMTVLNASLATPGMANWSTDFALGTLQQAFTPSQKVAVYRVLDVASLDYTNFPSQLLIYGSQIDNQGPQVGVSQMSGSYGNNWGPTPYPSTVAGDANSWEGGDSGSPGFIEYTAPGGSQQLTFMGTAWYPNMTNSYLPSLQYNAVSATYGYNPVPTVNNSLKANGYALKWTIYDNPSDPTRTAPGWTGGAGTSDFANAANWSNGVVPGSVPWATNQWGQAPDPSLPASVPILLNADAANGQTTLSLASNAAVRGMLFKASTSTAGFTFSGTGTLTVDYTGIRNESTATQTFNVPIALANSQNWEAANGNLVFNSTVNTGSGNLVVVGGAYDTTINGAISGSGFLAKDDAGTLTLNAVNTYSGNTIIHNGTLRLGPSGSVPGTGLLFIGGNGAFDLNGRTQSFSNLQSLYGGAGRLLLGGGNLTIVTTADGSIPYAGTIEGSGTIQKNQTGVLTLTGTDTHSGLTQLNRGIIRLLSPTALSPHANLFLVASDTAVLELGAGDFTESLGSGAGQVRLGGSSGSAGFGAYGADRIVNLGGAGAQVTWGVNNFANGNIGLALASATSNATLDFQNPINLNGAARTIVVANGSAPLDARLSGALSNGGLTKDGAGALELTGTNTYAGATTILAGALRLSSASALPASSNLILSGGVLELGAGDFSRSLGSGAGQVQFTGPSGGGFSAYGATRTVNLGGASATLVWGGTTNFVAAGKALILSSNSSNATVDFQNPINFNGNTATVQVNRGSANLDARLSGILSNGGLTKTGTGTLELTAANTYSGPTTVSGGALRISSASALPAASNLVLSGGVLELGAGNFTQSLGTGPGQVQFTGTSGGGFSAYGATRSVNLGGTGATLTWGATGGFVPAASALILSSSSSNATLDFQNPVNFNGASRTVQVDDGSAAVDARLSGILSNGGLTKTGSGVLELTAANTYSGPTTVSSGALRLSSASALPSGSNLVINGGVLELGAGDYTGALGTVAGQVQFTGSGGFAAYGGDRTVNFGGGGAAVTWTSTPGFLQNGQTLVLSSSTSTGTLIVQNPLILGAGAPQIRTIQVDDGSAAVDARFAGALTASTSQQGLIKTGTGTLELAGANNYGGPTTVSAGTLLVSGALNGGTAVDVQPSASFTYTGVSSLSSPVAIHGGAFVYNSSSVYTGALTFSSGILGGTGNLSQTAVTLGTGQTISPGNSPGTLRTGAESWAAGGSYLWQIANLSGSKGTSNGWDWLDINGSLDITASAGTPFTIALEALGALPGWSASQANHWTIASASGGISGFSSSSFLLDSSTFADTNPLNGGSFSLVASGNDLNLVYTPVPEPSSGVLFMLLAPPVLAGRRRRPAHRLPTGGSKELA